MKQIGSDFLKKAINEAINEMFGEDGIPKPIGGGMPKPIGGGMPKPIGGGAPKPMGGMPKPVGGGAPSPVSQSSQGDDSSHDSTQSASSEENGGVDKNGKCKPGG